MKKIIIILLILFINGCAGEDAFKKGTVAFHKGNFKMAIQKWMDHFYKMKKEGNVKQQALGAINIYAGYTNLNDKRLAIQWLDTAVGLAESSNYHAVLGPAYSAKARQFISEGLFAEAVSFYNKGLNEISPSTINDPEVHKNHIFLGLGEVYALLGDVNRADDSLNKISGQLYIKSHSDEFKKKIDKDKKNVINLVKALKSMEEKEYEGALTFFTEVLDFYKEEKLAAQTAFILKNIGDIQLERGQIEQALNSYNEAVNNLKETKLASDLNEKIYSSLAKAEKLKKDLPCDLAIKVGFSDIAGFFPNSSLDAYEYAEIWISIKNMGQGIGYGTNLFLSSDNPKIIFEKVYHIGDILPNETKELKIPLKAAAEIVDGKTVIAFDLKEKRGYAAKKLIMYVSTAKLVRPDLKIDYIEINDGNAGIARGNGNGVIENGETIELITYLKNQGKGTAVGVNLEGEKLSRGVDWIEKSAAIGTIGQGETAKVKLVFSVPRNSDLQEILVDLKATDVRGVSESQKKLAYALSVQRPNIHYAYKIMSRGGGVVGSIANGEEYDVELAIENRGRIPARGVVFELKPGPGVSISNNKIALDEIAGSATPQIRRFTIETPRTYGMNEAPLDIVISQADFAASKSLMTIPVDVRGPKLKYLVSLRSRTGDGTIEQGDAADLEIFVANDGNLSAEDVWVGIRSTDANFRIEEPQGQEKKRVGTVPAASKSDSVRFKVRALRQLKPGDVFVDINLAQKDFPGVASQYAINVLEEAAEVVHVAQEETKASSAFSKKIQSGPVINLKSSRATVIVEDEKFPLSLLVEDKRTIDKIYITVNSIKRFEVRPAARSKEIRETILLEPGENRIAVTAFNSDGERDRKEFVITRVQEDMHNPPVTGISNPDAFAVVIGNSAYKNIKNVDYAVNDARLVKKHLVNVLGFKEANIFFVENATKSDFLTLFGDDKDPKGMLYNAIKPGKSDVFVFYSGHGAPGLQDKKGYFVPVEANQQNIQFVGYPLDMFYENLSKVQARSLTVVTDACFSGADIYENVSPLFIEIKNPVISLNKGVVFSSSSGSQVSSWYNEKKQGLFTYFFLKAIRNNNADYNGDNKVTFDEIYRYISDNSEGVPYYARKLHGIEQTPTIEGNYEGKVFLKY